MQNKLEPMRNRYKYHLPEVYVEWPPLAFGTEMIPNKPVPLDVFQVTYLHYHRHLELGYCVRGSCYSYVGDKSETCQAGDITIVLPFQRHITCNATEDFSLWRWVYFDLVSLCTQGGLVDIATLEDIIQNEIGLYGVIDQQKYPEVIRQAKRVLEDAFPQTARRHGKERFVIDAYLLFLMLSDASADLPKLQRRTDQKLALIKPALNAINECLDREVLPSVESLSNTCLMSISYFRRIFHQVVGVSPKDYITMSCIRKATLLLSLTDQNVLEIAMHCGYQDISCFNRCFLKRTGITPTHYRRCFRGMEVPASTGGVLPSGVRAYGE